MSRVDFSRYIARARPGALGARFEEKRPLRETIAMPIRRHVFINRDSHPDSLVQ